MTTVALDLFDAIAADIERDDDGEAARETLKAGFPVYYVDAETPAGLVIKKHPDGRRELVSWSADGERPVAAL